MQKDPRRQLASAATWEGRAMAIYTDPELDYLAPGPGERRLGRLATVGPDGTPHVAPVGWSVDATGAIEVGGINLPATKKFKDVARTGRAAIVIDDVLPPWRPRGIEVRGRAEAVTAPEPRIRVHPERVVSWGLDGDGFTRNARTVSPPA